MNPPSSRSLIAWREASCFAITCYGSNEGKLTLNSMISIASNYAVADDDVRESLKASAIQNTRWHKQQQQKKEPD
jgi:hypothetical protein